MSPMRPMGLMGPMRIIWPWIISQIGLMGQIRLMGIIGHYNIYHAYYALHVHVRARNSGSTLVSMKKIIRIFCLFLTCYEYYKHAVPEEINYLQAQQQFSVYLPPPICLNNVWVGVTL